MLLEMVAQPERAAETRDPPSSMIQPRNGSFAMGRAIVHFEIEGLDAQRLRAFYGELFDWNVHVIPDNPAEYGLLKREENLDDSGNGIGGAISQAPEVPSSTWRGGTRQDADFNGHVTVFVEVPDVEQALQQAERLGGTRMLGPDPIRPGVEIGSFNDPEGHLIGVVTEQKAQTS